MTYHTDFIHPDDTERLPEFGTLTDAKVAAELHFKAFAQANDLDDDLTWEQNKDGSLQAGDESGDYSYLITPWNPDSTDEEE